MDEEGVTFFQPFGTAKVNAPTFTGSAGCSAGTAVAAKRKKTAAVNPVLMRKSNRERRKTAKKLCESTAAGRTWEITHPAFLFSYPDSSLFLLRVRHDKAPLDRASKGGLQ
jgi:hypothetical protein